MAPEWWGLHKEGSDFHLWHASSHSRLIDVYKRQDRGSLHEAIRASISIPMLFRPLRKDGMVLIDGGILNPLPLSHVQRTEGDILIAVDVNAPIETGKKKKISPYNLLTESSRMMMQQITRYQIERCQPDILIQMSGDTYDMLEFHHAASIVKTGVEVTRSVLKESHGD